MKLSLLAKGPGGNTTSAALPSRLLAQEATSAAGKQSKLKNVRVINSVLRNLGGSHAALAAANQGRILVPDPLVRTFLRTQVGHTGRG